MSDLLGFNPFVLQDCKLMQSRENQGHELIAAAMPSII